MGAALPLLLKLNCPAGDDRGIADFLKLVAGVTASNWVELSLVPENAEPAQTYSHGEIQERGTTRTLDVGEGLSATLRFGGGPKTSAEIIQALSLALASALECHMLRDQTAMLRAALDSTSISILLFDGLGDILYANPPADRLLSLQTEDELLVETEGEPGQPLFTLLGSLVERAVLSFPDVSGWQGILQVADGRVLACEVTCVQRQAPVSNAVLVLLQQFGSEPAARVDAFCASHGLSPREQEVVLLLVEGLTTIAMAEKLGISPHTVRDHLKNLYRKTGTNSRSKLLGLVSRTAPKTVGVRT